MKIKEISGKTALDSRAEKTIEVSVRTNLGVFVTTAPNGKSKGKHETPAYAKNIDDSIKNLIDSSGKISELKIEEFKDLEELEKIIGKKELGANPLFALETSILKALAAERGVELWRVINENARRFPYPVGNCIGGGLHTIPMQGRKPDFQEFLIIPRASRFSDNVFIMQGAHKTCAEILKVRMGKGNLNDEGAWGTSLDNEEALDVMHKLKDEIVEMSGEKVEIGVDIAASNLFSENFYHYRNKEAKLSIEEQKNFIKGLIERFGIGYVEDPFSEEDYKSFSELRKEVIKERPCLIVGDDLVASQLKRFGQALVNRSIGAVIVKPNQNGSLVEIKKLVDYAKKYDMITVMSHRSGESMDYALADLAFGFQTEFIKTGIFGREREIKLRRLQEIEKGF